MHPDLLSLLSGMNAAPEGMAEAEAAPAEGGEPIMAGGPEDAGVEAKAEVDHRERASHHLNRASKYAGTPKGSLAVHLRLAKHHLDRCV